MPGHLNHHVPSTPGAGAGQALTAKRSVRLLDPQGGGVHAPTAGTSTASQAYDPPRSPREGCEWVWFPAGYWAEREIVEMPSHRKPEPSTWPFRWNKRSVKESTGGWAQESPDDSPQEPVESPLSPPLLTPKPRQMPPLASPFLSETAHVQSLQHPGIFRESSTDSETSLHALGTTENKHKTPLSTPMPSLTADDPSQPPKQRRSYFQLRTSEDSTPPSGFTASGRLSTQPSLSPKTSNIVRVRPFRGPSPSFLGRPSNESFASATLSNGSESAPKDLALSTIKSSTELEPGTQQLKPQTRASEARKLSQLVKASDETVPKQSFMRRLMWEGHPVSQVTF